MKKHTPKKPRIIPLDELRRDGLLARVQAAQAAQVAVRKACDDLALIHKMEPAKVRYEMSPDGKSLILIDEV
jgi:hypothetical protein